MYTTHSSGPPPELLAVVFMVIIGIAVVMLAIQVFVSWFLSNTLARVPPQFRETEPWSAWLLLIPCFSLIWNFIFYPRCSRSLRNYFHTYNMTDVGDCGEQIGMIYAICIVCSAIPYIGALAGLASLVLWILYLVKMAELRKRLPPPTG